MPAGQPAPRLNARQRRLIALLTDLLGSDLGGRPACTGLAPTFDHELPDETPAEQTDRHRIAIRVCRGCPVRDACAGLADSLPSGTSAGVWGGRLRQPRRPGRPSKTA